MAELGNIEIRNISKIERIGAHSHITGLGLKENYEPLDIADGMVGQHSARKAAGLIVKMIKDGHIAGRALLIVGNPGTGKTAVAMAISKSVGEDTPFVSISASEVYSMVLKGEVVQVEIDRPATGVGPKVGKLTLKTTDMEAIYDIGNKMTESLIKERITSGDVIQIDKATGKITKIGRSISKSKDYDALGPQVKLVPCPSGEIQSRMEIVNTISLHDIDTINSQGEFLGSHGYMAVFSGDTGEIRSEVREQINKKVIEWREENKAQIIPGVLFVDEVHMLDLECFSFLNRYIESDLSPILVMATNRGITNIRGTSLGSPHGIPLDLLDRCLIIRTVKYTEQEIREILKIRSADELIEMDQEGLDFLVSVAGKTSLRYCMQLISTADIIRQRRKGEQVGKDDVEKAYQLFSDVGRCREEMEKYEDWLINDVN
uniref:RuvB-like helicase n=1 Tax=Meloidogyne hapla TaxID=6305 RepID=A0A1I8BNB9_MELHA